MKPEILQRSIESPLQSNRSTTDWTVDFVYPLAAQKRSHLERITFSALEKAERCSQRHVDRLAGQPNRRRSPLGSRDPLRALHRPGPGCPRTVIIVSLLHPLHPSLFSRSPHDHLHTHTNTDSLAPTGTRTRISKKCKQRAASHRLSAMNRSYSHTTTAGALLRKCRETRT